MEYSYLNKTNQTSEPQKNFNTRLLLSEKRDVNEIAKSL